jgi:hypothetical protein
MTLRTFPAFLTFLAQTLCFSAPARPVHGRRWLAKWRHNKPTAWTEGRPDAGHR